MFVLSLPFAHFPASLFIYKLLRILMTQDVALVLKINTLSNNLLSSTTSPIFIIIIGGEPIDATLRRLRMGSLFFILVVAVNIRLVHKTRML